jgi:hypothetical protein
MNKKVLGIVFLFLLYTYIPSVLALNVPFFSQRNSDWASDQLGTCVDLDMANWGCATTSKAMLFNYYQHSFTDPGELNVCLTENNGYAEGCLAPWDERNNVCTPPGVIFIDHVVTDIKNTIDIELSNGYPVIAIVKYGNDLKLRHFVVVTGKNGDTYSINDPYDKVYTSRTLKTGALGSYVLSALWCYHGLISPQDRSLARIQGQDPIYWLQNGKAYHVYNPPSCPGFDTIILMSNLPGWGWDKIYTYPASVLEIISPENPIPEADNAFEKGPDFFTTTGPESNGLLIKLPDAPEVYLVQNGERRWITEDVFNQLDYNLNNIITVTQAVFYFIPEGPPLNGFDYFIYSQLDTGLYGSYGVDGYVGPDGIDRIIFYSDWGWPTAYIYKVTISPGTDPNTHPNNPHATGLIAPRNFILERTFPLHNQWYEHDHEFFVGQDGFYLGAAGGMGWGADGIEHYDWNGVYLGKVVNFPAPDWPQSLAFDGINTWYAGCGGELGPGQERFVYKYIMGLSFDWEIAFSYISGDTSMAHHDGMEFVDGRLYLADYTGDYIFQFDPNSSWMAEPLNIFYHEPLSHELEGMGHGALNHFWVGSHSSTITEFGGGELQGVPVGNDITVSASPNITVTFDAVTGTGNISGVQDPDPPALPQGFSPVGPAYEVIFTGTFEGFVTICLNYDDSGITNSEDDLRLFHYEDSVWVDVTSNLDTENNIICGTTDSLSLFAVVKITSNQPPIAEAGPDQTVAVGAGCMAAVALDGSGSSDPDGDSLTYTWTWEGGSATGASPSIQLPLGAFAITLVVNDGAMDSNPDIVNINVVDQTLPDISLTVSPDTLWPPNHKMVLITPTITVTDNCDSEPALVLASITMNEGEETDTYDPNYDSTVGDGHTTDDIQVDESGNIYLRAERSGTGNGRIYTITYSATDASGNTSSASAAVSVPHNQ